jgi:hypothetical protein
VVKIILPAQAGGWFAADAALVMVRSRWSLTLVNRKALLFAGAIGC